MHRIKESLGLSLAVAAGVHWVRFDVFHWSQIEPVRSEPPTYRWDQVDEQSLRNAAANGLEVIATIKYTPEWAQKVPGYSCGPIKREALDEFAQFLTALVQRYSAPPYNIRYWELGNEPDVDPKLVPPDNIYGCWGDDSVPYYGGGYYAEMLKVAYPAIKAADPQAQVLIGGLLLGCNPTNPSEGSNCLSAKFMEGILRNGGGDYFDILSFHGYPLYYGSLYTDEHWPAWEERGGIVLGKVDFLREVMARYGVDKPLMHTEASLLCPENNPDDCVPPSDAFLEAQADYVVWLYVRNWAEGLPATIWYQFEGGGWRECSLLDARQQPKPAYRALAFLTRILGGATYQRPLTRFPELRGYAFRAPGKRVWVLWAPDERPHGINLPQAARRVYDKYGTDITPEGHTIVVQSPIYVELAP